MDFVKVGQLIRKTRKERGMTLDDLADDYIPRATLSSIERGLTQNHVKVRYLLRKLDLSLSELSKKDQEEAEERRLDLLILENKLYADPKKTLAELSNLPPSYDGPLLHFLKGRCHFKLKQNNKAVEYFHKALQEIEKTVDYQPHNLKPCILNNLSVIEFKHTKNKEKALRYVEEGIKSFDLGGERKYYYTILLTNKAIYLRALGRAEEALKTLEQITVDSLDINIETAIGIYDLQAKLKMEIKLYDEAAACAQRGLEIARINDNFERQLELYITLADIYRGRRELDRAEKCLKAAIDLKSKISRRHWLLLEAYQKLGIVYFEKKEFQLSHDILQKASKIANRENDMLKYSKTLLYIAKILLAEQKTSDAIKYLLKVYELDTDTSSKLEALFGLAQAYLALNDEPNYAKYSKQYFQLAKG
ncbi:tetratricopeptide repeat protein [Thermoactinomyces sp. CICC 10521]|uniref:tetratricopeptide repeat protein n=1 Tax=Thermoactinomyces sp. CICC 10521 TaxID=2767426 RepID=UPI0018DE33E3|nr:tetratricopeptide repeat protein [Thermoactinomyces sp. CICC 10521]MBH8608434.1 tetratricopeptide repeat protein [Thermoactinomyces sp. CICC 10521]